VFRFAAVVRRKVWLGLFFKCTPTSMLKLSVHRSKKGCVRHYSISFCKFSYLFSCPQTLLLLLIHLYSEPDESEAHIQGTLSSSCICIVFFLKKRPKVYARSSRPVALYTYRPSSSSSLRNLYRVVTYQCNTTLKLLCATCANVRCIPRPACLIPMHNSFILFEKRLIFWRRALSF
jgi:hypothetical protein